MKNLSYLNRHFNKYKCADVTDFIKLIFQSEFAGGHMIKSFDHALSYLNSEISSLDLNDNSLLYEYISDNIVRINLVPYLNMGYTAASLANIFYESSLYEYKNINLNKKVDHLVNLLKYNKISTSFDFNLFKQSPSAYHHSLIYNQTYKPHYRVIHTDKLSLELRVKKLQSFVDTLDSTKLHIVALEGRCASGKSTISEKLENVTVIHADDFFSKTDLLDFDLLREALLNLKLGEKITYKCYSCQTDSYYFKTIDCVKNVVIVEGVYSYHHKIRNLYDYLAYVEVSKETQLKRINNRKMVDRFINEWIPREEIYYDDNNYIVTSDIII